MTSKIPISNYYYDFAVRGGVGIVDHQEHYEIFYFKPGKNERDMRRAFNLIPDLVENITTIEIIASNLESIIEIVIEQYDRKVGKPEQYFYK